jgi:hypothetical protein
VEVLAGLKFEVKLIVSNSQINACFKSKVQCESDQEKKNKIKIKQLLERQSLLRIDLKLSILFKIKLINNNYIYKIIRMFELHLKCS